MALELGPEPERPAADAGVPGAVLAPPFVLGEHQLVRRSVAVLADWLCAAGPLVPRPVRVVLVFATFAAGIRHAARMDTFVPFQLVSGCKWLCTITALKCLLFLMDKSYMIFQGV